MQDYICRVAEEDYGPLEDNFVKPDTWPLWIYGIYKVVGAAGGSCPACKQDHLLTRLAPAGLHIEKECLHCGDTWYVEL